MKMVIYSNDIAKIDIISPSEQGVLLPLGRIVILQNYTARIMQYS
jgi:hypothetical protein